MNENHRTPEYFEPSFILFPMTYYDSLSAAYDAIAPWYDRFRSPRPEQIKFFSGLTAPGPVLDIGAGTGFLTLALAERGFAVTAVEPSRPMLDELQKTLDHRQLQAKLIHASTADFQVAGRFPLVVACLVFGHLLTEAEWRASLGNIHQHLQPDGILAFDLGNPAQGGAVTEERESCRCEEGDDLWLQILERRELKAHCWVSHYRVEHWRNEILLSSVPLVSRTTALSPSRILHLLTETGFIFEEIRGGYQGEEFDEATSSTLRVVARRMN